jgi:hypothetical protein
MSELNSRLKKDLVVAMKSKDNFKRDTIRFLMSALKQVEVDERKELCDDDIVKIIQKSIKQRDDSAQQFKNAGRDDLYEKESAEAQILKTYLPEQLNDEELIIIIKNIISKTKASSIKDIGKVMGMALKECQGKSDGKRINDIANKLLG